MMTLPKPELLLSSSEESGLWPLLAGPPACSGPDRPPTQLQKSLKSVLLISILPRHPPPPLLITGDTLEVVNTSLT